MYHILRLLLVVSERRRVFMTCGKRKQQASYYASSVFHGDRGRSDATLSPSGALTIIAIEASRFARSIANENSQGMASETSGLWVLSAQARLRCSQSDLIFYAAGDSVRVLGGQWSSMQLGAGAADRPRRSPGASLWSRSGFENK